ncbi:MAG TPA: hypothetical protein VMU82_00940 [Acetobacteraceae bacterium]|nr:hypothetical protein [Acetobacteraceae bacterium]
MGVRHHKRTSFIKSLISRIFGHGTGLNTVSGSGVAYHHRHGWQHSHPSARPGIGPVLLGVLSVVLMFALLAALYSPN